MNHKNEWRPSIFVPKNVLAQKLLWAEVLKITVPQLINNNLQDQLRIEKYDQYTDFLFETGIYTTISSNKPIYESNKVPGV